MCTLLLSDGLFYVSWILLIKGAEFFYILAECLIVLSTVEDRELKSPTIIVKLSVFPFSPISFSFACFIALFLGAYTFTIAVFLVNQPFYHH